MTATTGSGKYEELLARCQGLPPVATAVAHPCEQSALAGAVEAGALGLITPILVGPTAKIEEIAKTKLQDLNTTSLESAIRTIEGTARQMGLTVE